MDKSTEPPKLCHCDVLQSYWSKCDYHAWYYGPSPFELNMPAMLWLDICLSHLTHCQLFVGTPGHCSVDYILSPLSSYQPEAIQVILFKHRQNCQCKS